MLIDSDQKLIELLSRVKTIAVLGASDNPARPSHSVFRFLCDEGFNVIPVNPNLVGTQLLGRDVLATLADIKGPVDMVDVFRDGKHLPDIVQSVIHLGIPALWTQLDVRNAEAEQAALAEGIDLVVDRCPAIELPRLRALGQPG